MSPVPRAMNIHDQWIVCVCTCVQLKAEAEHNVAMDTVLPTLAGIFRAEDEN